MRILVVDDDTRFAGALSTGLRVLGHDVTVVDPAGATDVPAGGFDLAVVDADPAGGREFLSRYHARAPELRVVVLTSALTAETAVEYLRGGAAALAVDCIEKPATNLAARIDEAAQRYVRRVERGPFMADSTLLQGYYNGRSLELTEHEYAVFELFMRRPYRVISYERMGEAVFGEAMSHEYAYRALRSVVSRLRRKLREAAGRPVLSRHVDGDGIRFLPGGEDARRVDLSKTPERIPAAGR